MSASLRWALALCWGCAWSLAWLQGWGAWCFALGWTPVWALAVSVLVTPRAPGRPRE